jgi:UDP-N-acetyl-2-amino-2-deoxyglucuronate dehydrogenase
MTTYPLLPDLRFGIIGSTASIAVIRVKALTRLPGASIAGMADVAVERGEARAREVGCPFFADHCAMLDTIRPDVAVICAPYLFRATLAIDCLKARAHMLVEKSLAASVSKADAMITASASGLLPATAKTRCRSVADATGDRWRTTLLQLVE